MANPIPVVVISSRFLAQSPVKLTVVTKLRTFGERDLTFKDVSGTIIFTVKSNHTSFRGSRKLLDSNGNVLVSLRHKLRNLHSRWMAYRGDSMDVERDLLFKLGTPSLMHKIFHLDVFLAGNEQQQVPDFKIREGSSNRSCVVYLGNTTNIIAKMNKGVDNDDFTVTINPNVDHSFIVSLVVILDKIDEDARIKREPINPLGLDASLNSITKMFLP